MTDSAIFGLGLFGVSRYGGKQVQPTAAAFARDLYRLEVWSGAGVRLAVLPNWRSAAWTQTANKPSILQFTYPFNDEFRSLITYPNQIRIYDRFNVHIDTLTVMVVTSTRTIEGNLFIAVECDGLFAQLGRDLIESYDSVTDENTTVIDILDALFDLQTRTNIAHIQRGNISAAIRDTAAISVFENKSILQAILELQATVGGVMSVNPIGTFKWSQETGSNTDQQIRDNKNLQAITVSANYRNIFTKIIAYGKSDANGVRLQKILNNASAQSTYGVLPLIVSWNDVGTALELEARATKKLREISRADTTISFNSLDLSQVTDPRFDYSHEALTIGSRIDVIDDQIGEVHPTRISSISRDLAAPMGVTLEVQNPDDFNVTGARAETPPNFLSDFLDIQNAVQEGRVRDTGQFDMPLLLDELDPPNGVSEAGDICVWDETDDTGNLETKIEDVLEFDTDGTIISLDTPEDTGSPGGGDPGTSNTLSASDHVHASDPGTILGTGTPEDVGPAGVQGDANDAAPFNHVHAGKWLTYTGP